MTAANNDDQFRRLCEVTESPELSNDPRFSDNAKRVENRTELANILNSKLSSKPISHWMTVLQEAGLTVTPINTIEDVLKDPQAQARNSIWKVQHSSLGEIDLLGSALQHLSRTAATPQGHPPLLGEHTYEILEAVLGMSKEEIKKLSESEVIKGTTA